MATEVLLERDSVRLAGIDFGGDGPGVLLLHGLAGYAGEWAETARWLRTRARVIAFDARGHGNSERLPADVSRAAFVADAAFAVERMGLPDRVVVVGQSLGGLTALSLSAERPDLVCGAVMIEAGARGDGDATNHEAVAVELGDALRRWPVPFASREAAVEFFGGPSLNAETWASGLEHLEGGWWPSFDVETMMLTLREASNRSYWEDWDRISCSVLLVRGGNGSLARTEAQAMVARGRQAKLVELADAGHDLHLDQPDEWRKTLFEFLDSLGR